MKSQRSRPVGRFWIAVGLIVVLGIAASIYYVAAAESGEGADSSSVPGQVENDLFSEPELIETDSPLAPGLREGRPPLLNTPQGQLGPSQGDATDTSPQPNPSQRPSTLPGTEPSGRSQVTDSGSPDPDDPSLATWYELAMCESSGNWRINSGNGFYGGLQFTLESWRHVGGRGYPHEHSAMEQIRRAEILLDEQGWIAWPVCSRRLGLRE